MSTTEPQPPPSDGDLIDLNAGSSLPPAPQVPPSPEPTNLLDSELPDLEEKLKSSSTAPPPDLPKCAVDVEDILITLDDDELESNEALTVLMKLDDLLEASLMESNKILKGYSEEEAVELDECLMELDDYLNSCECDETGRPERAEAFTRNAPQRATFSTHPEAQKNAVVYRSLRATGAVVVEVPEVKDAPAPWLRSSMRRLQHLRMPPEVDVAQAAQQAEEEEVQVPVVVVNNAGSGVVRPVSAPSVLMQSEGGGSTSSRSRRPRSVSSVSSFGSSVESTPSCTPEPTPTRSSGQQEQSNGAGARRCVLLLSARGKSNRNLKLDYLGGFKNRLHRSASKRLNGTFVHILTDSTSSERKT